MKEIYLARLISILSLLPFLCILVPAVAQDLPPVVISEFMSSNSVTIIDEDGEFSDWIEIRNISDNPVDIEGWGLTDNENNPFKWTFPACILQPGEFMLVWASGKDRKPAQGTLVNGLRQQVYKGITGTSVNDLISSSSYPGMPSSTEILTDLFETGVNVDDNYGQRVYGLLKAPQTGTYYFWISGDDNSRLYLSSDEDPHKVALIAEVPEWTNSREWNKYASQKSGAIYLEEGKYYFMQALMKEEGGGDHLSVGWQLPDGTLQQPMPADQFYLAPAELHTTFSISADGETLLISNAQGEPVHYVPGVALPSDVSYGSMDGQEGFFYFNIPTPGSANSDQGYRELFNGSITFSKPGGFYTEPFDLVLNTDDPEAVIYYTVDGSEPDPANLGGTTYRYKNSYPWGSLLERSSRTYVYEEPVNIRDRSNDAYQIAGINTYYANTPRLPSSQKIFMGTVIKAKAVKENALSLFSETHTYFITDKGRNRYDLPVVSITTDEANLFDYYNGIYVPGKYADDWAAANPGEQWNESRPANYNQRGDAWERRSHFEYFPTNGDPAFRHKVGLRIHGGYSRGFYRKSLRLYARTEYGSGNTMNYPFFGELPARGDSTIHIESFRRLLLRNSGNDYYLTLYRDALMQSLASHLPVDVMGYNPVVHFLNGEYWGIINIRERFDQHYVASHYSLPSDDIALLETFATIDEGYPEDRDNFLAIVAYAQNNDPANSQHYQWLYERVDVDNLAHYYAAQIYFYNTDWPQNNSTFWRYRNGTYSPELPKGHDGRWRWMLFDTDFGMSIWSEDHAKNALSRVINEATDPSSIIFKRLLRNTDFKNKFINAVADQLNSGFRPQYIRKKVDEFNARLSSSRNEHYQRWMDGTDTGSSIKNFGDKRTPYVISHTQSQFNLSGTNAVTVNRVGDGGLVKINSLLIDSRLPGIPYPASPYPWSGNYFKSVPITLTAIDQPGYRFSHWVINNSKFYDRTVVYDVNGAVEVFAHFKEAQISLLHYWHFNDLISGNQDIIPADISITEIKGSLSYPGTGAGYMDDVDEGSSLNSKESVEAGLAIRARNPSDTRHLEILIPTTGFEEIRISYATTRTSKGAQQQNVYYRTAADAEWILFATGLIIPEDDFRVVSLDFSNVEGVKDNEEFALKIEFAGSQASGSSGNNRFDNIVVEGLRITTGIKDNQATVAINVYPIPARDYIDIVSSSPIARLSLYNSNGQMVKDMKSGGLAERVSVGDLHPGIYIIEITTQGDVVRKKITISR